MAHRRDPLQTPRAISRSIISPNTCSFLLHVHDKSICLSHSQLLIHPSLCFCSLALVLHAGSGLRGLSVPLLADALCRAAGFWPICPLLLFTSSTVRKQCTPDATAVTAEPSEPKWLPSLWALDGRNDPRPDYWMQTLRFTKAVWAKRRRWFLSSFARGVVTTLANAHGYRILCGRRWRDSKVHGFCHRFLKSRNDYIGDDRIVWLSLANVVLAPDE